MRIFFFRTPSPKRFEYTPRYYDEEKERRERRRQELAGENAGSGNSIRFADDWRRLRNKDRTRRKSKQVSILVYLIIAAILLYFVFLT